VDLRSLSAQHVVGLAKALGLPLNALLDEDLPGGELAKPLLLPVYRSPEDLAREDVERFAITPEQVPPGAEVGRLAYLTLPGRWFTTLSRLRTPTDWTPRSLVLEWGAKEVGRAGTFRAA
jgi:hypothetical protein